jgi:hypothetical protein
MNHPASSATVTSLMSLFHGSSISHSQEAVAAAFS